jgi:hypothetical protein
MNAFLDKRIAVLERRLLASREPLVITIRGGLDSERTATAFSTSNPDRDLSSGYTSSASAGRSCSNRTWSQGPSESGERFRRRVLSEAGEVEFVVFSSLTD